MRPLVITLALLALFIAVPVVVLGQALTPDDPGGTLQFVLRALGDRSWIALAGGATILVVWALRRYASNWIPWFATRIGGVVLVVACGALTAVGSSLAGGHFSLKELLDGILTAVVASGGFSLGKNAVQAVKQPAP